MTLNVIYSDAEYLAQGFRPEDVKRSDVLFNKRDEWTQEEHDEYYRLIKKLKL